MRIWLFRAIALILPLLVLLLAELAVRASGAGGDWPLFKVNPANPAYLVTEADIVKRYFASTSSLPTVKMEPAFLLAAKPANGIRLVVQGGSTAAGYPYGAGASLAAMLEQRLSRTFTGQRVEVVNTALAAVNSYTLLDLADEIIAVKPDAVLIYAGHNEYLGLLGVGSHYLASQSPAITRLLISLRKLHSFQLIEQLYQQMNPLLDETEHNSRTFMAKVARDKDIALGSAQFEAGLKQFDSNLSRLLAKYQRAGIPVYISTLVSNLADQPPFNSKPVPAATRQQLAQLAQTSPDTATYAELLQALTTAATAANSAELHYQLGRHYQQRGEAEQAKQQFLLAKEHDLLRFRAPEAINQQIRQLAGRYNATLVDSEAAFIANSPQGITGNSLLLEHVHPNVQGYFLLADSFYKALARKQTLGSWQKPVATTLVPATLVPATLVPANVAWQERPITPAEEHAGYLRILQLKADYPFRPEPQTVQLPPAQTLQQQWGQAYVEGKLDWLSLQNRNAQYYHQQGDGDMLLKTLKIIADALPHDANANIQAAQILLKAGRSAEAKGYLQRARLAPEAPAQVLQQMQQLAAALAI
ncbi:GDSL-type esterase/lipase family protein [Arsukibacterium sp.]|uniref:GDSL-type esterase/lipase family protein n=1 Tax=Arsukibacterium sp. TaxID=1977258 RepID=UPI00299D0E2A|nr:GDSL-type esterase/lipase family protein [Arsukibacterium sp.]MDX1537096.1 GDSL-type esterase/lipase family protein [Arsukibacterium sp.]